MSKHEQKIKAVKDLQEEYDRRSEIEEQAFALLAEGKFKEAQELLDSLDDKQALEMLKESVGEYKRTYGQHSKCHQSTYKSGFASLCRVCWKSCFKSRGAA